MPSGVLVLVDACRLASLWLSQPPRLEPLRETLRGIANMHLDAVEYGEGIVFLHAVKVECEGQGLWPVQTVIPCHIDGPERGVWH